MQNCRISESQAGCVPLAILVVSHMRWGDDHSLIHMTLQSAETIDMGDSKVVVRDNGPLLLTGIGTVEDAEGNSFDTGWKETIALCRCGVSKNRPFCDGAHRDCNFEAAERAGI